MKIKKGDTVSIISGKDKGKKGKVVRVFPKESRILVEGVNLRKKHRRAKKMGEKGQVITIASPIHVSNVMLVCPKCSKLTRIGATRIEGKTYRMCKKCNSEF
jgi:large subunit ribosomal protein L24